MSVLAPSFLWLPPETLGQMCQLCDFCPRPLGIERVFSYCWGHGRLFPPPLPHSDGASVSGAEAGRASCATSFGGLSLGPWRLVDPALKAGLAARCGRPGAPDRAYRPKLSLLWLAWIELHTFKRLAALLAKPCRAPASCVVYARASRVPRARANQVFVIARRCCASAGTPIEDPVPGAE